MGTKKILFMFVPVEPNMVHEVGDQFGSPTVVFAGMRQVVKAISMPGESNAELLPMFVAVYAVPERLVNEFKVQMRPVDPKYLREMEADGAVDLTADNAT